MNTLRILLQQISLSSGKFFLPINIILTDYELPKGLLCIATDFCMSNSNIVAMALQVWLIEVNINPAMHINCNVLKDVVPPVLEETLGTCGYCYMIEIVYVKLATILSCDLLAIAVEVWSKSRRSKSLFPLQSQRSFVTLWNGK